MLKLNLQLFAEGETQSVDTDAIRDEQQKTQNVADEFKQEVDGAIDDVKSLDSDQGLQSVAGNAIQSVFGYIAPKLGEFQTVVTDLGGFLSYVVTTYDASDEAMRKEFESWGESVTGIVKNIKSGFTEVASGYTSTQYVTDLSSSTRTIATEVTNMISNTGKLWSSATGKSVLTSGVELGKAAVGTINTLFTSLASGNFGSIGTSFVNGLMGAK